MAKILSIADIKDSKKPWIQNSNLNIFELRLKQPLSNSVSHITVEDRNGQPVVVTLTEGDLFQQIRQGAPIPEDSIWVSPDRKNLQWYSQDNTVNFDVEKISYQEIDGNELKTVAATKGLEYGAALDWQQFRDNELVSLISKEISIVCVENSLKWATLRPQQNAFNFEKIDSVYQFCQKNNLRLKGHCLVWYFNNPSWLEATVNKDNAVALLTEHINTVVNRFKGKVSYWDVVNEPVNPNDGNLLTDSVWYKALGEQYIDAAFSLAHSADPTAKLGINDFALENTSLYHNCRRKTLLRLVSRLVSRGVPIHYVGIESHLDAGDVIDKNWCRVLIEALRFDFGLEVWISEIDVDDRTISASDIATRDKEVANTYFDYLTTVLKAGIKGIIGWGISNKYNWLNQEIKRADNLPKRSFPFDEDLNRTPAHQAIREAIINTQESRLPNLISNYTDLYGFYSSVNSVSLDNKTYLHVTDRQGAWAGAAFNLPKPPKEGQKWFVSFWIRVNPCQIKATIKSTSSTGSSQYQNAGFLDIASNKDSYYFGEITGFTGTQDSAFLFIEGSTADDYWIRGVKLFLLSEPTAKLTLPANINVASYRDKTPITVTLTGFDVGSTYRLQWRNASSGATSPNGTNEAFAITSDPQTIEIDTETVASYIALNGGDFIELLIDDVISNQIQGVY